MNATAARWPSCFVLPREQSRAYRLSCGSILPNNSNTYAPVAKRHPNVRFLRNRDATLDEALAAADIVVVPNSGFGSDALVRRRFVIVLDLPTMRLGHGRELIEQAGCPASHQRRGIGLGGSRPPDE